MKKKRKTIENVRITGIADKGQAVGRTLSGEVVFVKGAVPGDLVHLRQLRNKKGVKQGEVIEIVEASEHRVTPPCVHFYECGGCKWQDLAYYQQLNEKERVVRDAIERIAGIKDTTFHPIMGMEADPYHYRNKMEYTFTANRWLTEEEIQSGVVVEDRRGLGLHKPGAFDAIVDIHNCLLQTSLPDRVRNAIREFTIKHDFSYYHKRSHEGFLRTLIIKHMRSGDLMVIVVYAFEDREKMQLLHDFITSEFKEELSSLYYMINDKKNDSLFDIDAVHLAGKEEIHENLGKIKYAIGPKSFFQTNTVQAEHLYDKVVEYAELQKDDVVYDLYTGLGSIALYVAESCKSVVGIEEIPEAIADADKNAAMNGIENCTFYAGDVRDILRPEFAETHGKPDVIITDPPRAGMHEDVVNTILELAPRKIVYVSCNPATCARDIARLSDKYILTDVQAVDMFPHTSHIECVTKLIRRDE